MRTLATLPQTLALTILTGIAACAGELDSMPYVGDDLSFADAVFRATHNSYAGGPRGSLGDQLEAGVRVLELDIHESDFATHGFRIGHDRPGDEVLVGGGNPGDSELATWLAWIADWSDAHPGHAPITLYIDLKSDLTNNGDFAGGNLARLDHELDRVLGVRRLTAEEVGPAWPTVASLRGRVLTVLSGNRRSRTHYLRDVGRRPAVAMNRHGQVLELHHSRRGEIWYWTGHLDDRERVRWSHHGPLGHGFDPAVLLEDDGTLVEVHTSIDGRLWYRTGQLRDDGTITWRIAASTFPGDDEGKNPSIAAVSSSPLQLHEVHQSRRTDLGYYWNGTLAADGTIEWTRSDDGRTDQPRYPTHVASIGETWIEAWSQDSDLLGETVLRYATGGAEGYIRYPQSFFVDRIRDEDGAVAIGARFAGIEGERLSAEWVEAQAQAGRVARAWSFEPDESGDLFVPLPATDEPFAPAYDDYCQRQGCIED